MAELYIGIDEGFSYEPFEEWIPQYSDDMVEIGLFVHENDMMLIMRSNNHALVQQRNEIRDTLRQQSKHISMQRWIVSPFSRDVVFLFDH